MAGETIMSIAYGITVQAKDDVYIGTAEQGARSLFLAAIPGTFLVDTIPFLKYVPAWMPGAGFQRKAHEWRKHARKMVELPYQAAKKHIVSLISFKLRSESYSEPKVRGDESSMLHVNLSGENEFWYM